MSRWSPPLDLRAGILEARFAAGRDGTPNPKGLAQKQS